MKAPKPGFTWVHRLIVLSAGIKYRPYRRKKIGAWVQRPILLLTVNTVPERICHVPFMLYKGLILPKTVRLWFCAHRDAIPR
jgi:hypothetical protein